MIPYNDQAWRGWYEQYMQQLMQAPQTPAYHQSNGPTKVNGIQSAMQMGYQMGPNCMSEAIFDMGGKVFYIVSTDGAGVPSVETFDFSPHVEPEQPTGEQFVSRSEFDEAIASLKEAIDGIYGNVPAAAV